MTHDKELIEAMVGAVERLIAPKRGEADPVCRALPPWHIVMKAALDAHTAYLESKGLVVVPREPTSEMCSVGQFSFTQTRNFQTVMGLNEVSAIYQDMVQAAQEDE